MKYEFTITLLPCTYIKSAQEQKALLHIKLCELLAIYQVSAVYELTSMNNVHVHMMIEFKDFKHKSKFIDSLRPLKKGIVGQCHCSQVMNEGKWSVYMAKDLQTTRELIGDPIIKDDFQILCDPAHRFVFIELTPGQWCAKTGTA